MKKILFVILAISATIVSTSNLAFCVSKTITVDWSISDASNIEGYKIFFSYSSNMADKILACESNTPTITSLTCNNINIDRYPVYFTVVALTPDGEFESAIKSRDLRLSSVKEFQVKSTGDEQSASYAIDIRIDSSTNDAEEAADGDISLTSSDLELIYALSNQVVGLRFTNIGIPKGSQITNAYIEFEADEAQSETTSLIIKAENSASPQAFFSTAYNISDRATFSNYVEWNNIEPWSTVGQKYTTPNIAPVIQEVTNLNDWTEGNAIVFIITGSGHRTAESYDGKESAAPLLHVEYSVNP